MDGIGNRVAVKQPAQKTRAGERQANTVHPVWAVSPHRVGAKTHIAIMTYSGIRPGSRAQGPPKAPKAVTFLWATFLPASPVPSFTSLGRIDIVV